MQGISIWFLEQVESVQINRLTSNLFANIVVDLFDRFVIGLIVLHRFQACCKISINVYACLDACNIKKIAKESFPISSSLLLINRLETGC